MELDKLPNGHVMDVKNILVRFTTDLIGSTAFGLNVKSLANPNNDFFKFNVKIFEITLRRALELVCLFIIPSLVPLLRVKLIRDNEANFVRKALGEIFEQRRKSGAIRNDVVDKLIAMQNEAKLDPTDPGNDTDYIMAQAVGFLIAGSETSSSTTSFALYELAKNPDIQDRLHAEIMDAFAAEDSEVLSYEKVNEMKYLSQLVDETLRLYPIAGFVERQLTIADKLQEFSLLPDMNYAIPKGMPVYVSLLGLHRDEKVIDIYSRQSRHIIFHSDQILTKLSYLSCSTGKNP